MIELHKANEYLNVVRHAENFVELSEAWRDFLQHLDRAWNMISKAEAEYGRQITPVAQAAALRRKDPLLRYLLESRNAHEHEGVQDMTTFEAGSFLISVEHDAEVAGTTTTFDENGLPTGIKLFDTAGNDVPIKIHKQTGPRVRLLPVFDRRGNQIDPPAEHLGEALSEPSITEVGQRGLSYYRALFDKAVDDTRHSQPKKP